MKKVTTNITFGQILFILLTVFFASLMFFYLGAKFGPKVLNMGDNRPSIDDPILPDERLAKEIKQLLKEKKHDFVFHEVLQDKQSLKQIQPKESQKPKLNEKDLISEKTVKETKSKKTSDKTKNTKKKKESSKKVATTKKDTQLKNNVIIKKINSMEIKIAEPKVITVGKNTTIETDIDPEPVEQKKPVYRLQLGSYSEKKKAESSKNKWKKRGYPVRVVRAKISGKGYWYRLQLGNYVSLNEVMNAQKSLMKKYRQSSRVVKSGK